MDKHEQLERAVRTARRDAAVRNVRRHAEWARAYRVARPLPKGVTLVGGV